MRKSKRILIILAFILLLGLIYMPSKTLAAEDGEIWDITIGANEGKYVSSVNLYLEEHETEQLKSTIKVWKNSETVEDDSIQANWSSSDENVVTVSSTGLLTAQKEGKATITATIEDKTRSIEVNVKPAPVYPDLSDIEYKWYNYIHGTSRLALISENAVKWDKNTKDGRLYAIVTKANTRPEIVLNKNGGIDIQNNKDLLEIYTISSDYSKEYQGYLDVELNKYLELNQDIYLWVISENKLDYDSWYSNENGAKIGSFCKFVISGEKIEKRDNPVYSGLFWASFIDSKGIQIELNLPRDTNGKQRNFNLKIGKITDEGILNKIKNGATDGFANLEEYAKLNSPVYEGKLTTNEEFWLGYKIEGETLPLAGKLEDDEYYYVYVIFDDENGKYAPIEHCLTLGQASVHEDDKWYLLPYGDDKFKWREFSTENTGGDYTPTGTDGTIQAGSSTGADQTISTTSLPHTGISYAIIGIIAILGVSSIVFYFKNNKYKGI